MPASPTVCASSPPAAGTPRARAARGNPKSPRADSIKPNPSSGPTMPLGRTLSCTLALTLALGARAETETDSLEALLQREVEGPSRYAQSLLDAPAAVAVFGRQ